MADIHRHQCPKCKCVWEHCGDENRRNSQAAHDAHLAANPDDWEGAERAFVEVYEAQAHSCPECKCFDDPGTLLWYEGRRKPQYVGFPARKV
jgi:hypothetical protein